MSQKSYYKKLGELEVNDRNPFLQEIIQGDRMIKSGSKMIFGKGENESLIISPEGEQIGHAVFARFKQVDREQFVKLYTEYLSAFFDLNQSSLRVFTYILRVCKPGIDRVYINISECMEYTRYSSRATITSAIADLIEKNFIAKTKEKYWFFINPSIFFNGDRISFIKTFQVKPDETKGQIGNSESGTGQVPEVPEG